jgi:hypothetical protein
MNEPLETVLVSPMTTTLRSYPTRLNLTKIGQVALDHSWRSMASVWSAGWARFRLKAMRFQACWWRSSFADQDIALRARAFRLLYRWILVFRRPVTAQQLGKILGEGGTRENHVASHFMRLLL